METSRPRCETLLGAPPRLFAGLQGDVAAERLLLEVVLEDRVRAGPAPAADVQVFAIAAPALVLLEGAQRLEELGVVPDLLERLLLHVSRHDREVGARLDVAVGVDEADRLGADAPLPAARRECERPGLEPV